MSGSDTSVYDAVPTVVNDDGTVTAMLGSIGVLPAPSLEPASVPDDVADG